MLGKLVLKANGRWEMAVISHNNENVLNIELVPGATFDVMVDGKWVRTTIEYADLGSQTIYHAKGSIDLFNGQPVRL